MSRHELDLPQEQELTRREILQRALTMSPLLLSLPTLAAACSPARRTQAQDNPTSFGGEIPAHIRGQLPESIARATEEAARPKEAGLPTVANIKVIGEVFNPCQFGLGPGGEGLWGGWVVKLDRKDYYLKRGVFSMEKKTPSGSPIGEPITLATSMLPPDIDFFIPAVTEQSSGIHLGDGSKLGQINLKMGKMEWAKVDDSPKEYGFSVTVPEASLSYERTAYNTTPLQFKFDFENTGELAINNILGMATLSDREGNLLDILGQPYYMGSSASAPFGRKVSLKLTSLVANFNAFSPNAPRCAGQLVDGTRIMLWVYFQTRTGIPVVHKDTITVV